MKIGEVEKLMPNLKGKKTYVRHMKRLNQELMYSLKLKEVHRVIIFEQSYWMKPDIMLNTRLKTSAKNEFQKEVFGKTMENIRNHKDIKLMTSRERYQKHVIKPKFKDGYLFSKDLFAVEIEETEIEMNNLVHLVQVILDLIKRLMYEFYYY